MGDLTQNPLLAALLMQTMRGGQGGSIWGNQSNMGSMLPLLMGLVGQGGGGASFQNTGNNWLASILGGGQQQGGMANYGQQQSNPLLSFLQRLSGGQSSLRALGDTGTTGTEGLSANDYVPSAGMPAGNLILQMLGLGQAPQAGGGQTNYGGSGSSYSGNPLISLLQSLGVTTGQLPQGGTGQAAPATMGNYTLPPGSQMMSNNSAYSPNWPEINGLRMPNPIDPWASGANYTQEEAWRRNYEGTPYGVFANPWAGTNQKPPLGAGAVAGALGVTPGGQGQGQGQGGTPAPTTSPTSSLNNFLQQLGAKSAAAGAGNINYDFSGQGPAPATFGSGMRPGTSNVLGATILGPSAAPMGKPNSNVLGADLYYNKFS